MAAKVNETMRLSHTSELSHASFLGANAVILPVFADSRFVEEFVAWDEAMQARIARQAEAQSFKADLGKTMVCFNDVDSSHRFAIVLGLGKRKELTRKKLTSALVAAIKSGRDLKARTVAVSAFGLADTNVGAVDYGHALAEAAMLAQYKYHLKTEKGGHKPEHAVEELVVQHPNEDVGRALSPGRIVADAVAFARELSDTPANLLMPDAFKDRTIEVSARSGGKITIEIMNRERLLAKGANGILAVAAGSPHPCYMIVLTYTPRSGPTMNKLALIGKTVCFDAGGICLKPAASMAGMHRDMSGGANVLGAIEAIAALDIPLSVMAIFAPVVNMTGGNAAKVCDVIRMMDGHTVENINTDAEGRLTLGDMVAEALARGAKWMIDMATLTGAALAITGSAAACLMGNNDYFTNLIHRLSGETGENMQVLTMFEEIRAYNKSEVADLQNTPGSKGAGTIAAGWFIREFAGEDVPWAHLDIAPVMKEAFGVKTMVRVAEALAISEMAEGLDYAA